MSEPIVAVDGLNKIYRTGRNEVHALKDATFTVQAGQLLAVKGRSGSGKTTLLNLIGGLDRPESGRVVVDGQEVTSLDETSLLRLRRDTIGFVFQSFGLIPVLSAAENVSIPMRLRATPPAARDARVALLLALVGLDAHTRQRPYELSGGQQQRVAIARALANEPRLLIADEPTGQLDSQTGKAIMQLIQALVATQGVTAIVATHDPTILQLAHRVIELKDGRVVSDDLLAAAYG